MKQELEKIITDEFDCLIDDLGCLIGEEWVAESIKEVVGQAFVLGVVSQQRELLNRFFDWEDIRSGSKINDRKQNNKHIDEFLKSI